MQRLTRMLSLLVSTLAVVSSVGGLLMHDLYRDSELYKASWQANDVVTLVVAVFLLRTRGEHSRSQRVLWLGMMSYMFYNFCFYLFGAVFNLFFLIYAALVSLSLFALFIGICEMQRSAAEEPTIRLRTVISIFLILMAAPLTFVEVSQYVRFVITGVDPDIPTLVMALDLSLVIPAMCLAVVLLFRQHASAGWVTGIILFKAFSYGMVLTGGALWIAIKGVGPLDKLLPFYIFIMTGGFVFTTILLRNYKTNRVSL